MRTHTHTHSDNLSFSSCRSTRRPLGGGGGCCSCISLPLSLSFCPLSHTHTHITHPFVAGEARWKFAIKWRCPCRLCRDVCVSVCVDRGVVEGQRRPKTMTAAKEKTAQERKEFTGNFERIWMCRRSSTSLHLHNSCCCSQNWPHLVWSRCVCVCVCLGGSNGHSFSTTSNFVILVLHMQTSSSSVVNELNNPQNVSASISANLSSKATITIFVEHNLTDTQVRQDG